MSSSYSTKVGPYLKCRNRYTETIHEFDGCPKCQKHRSTKFCGICGTEVGKFSSTVKELNVITGYLIEEIDEKLYPLHHPTDIQLPEEKEGNVKFDYWLPNKSPVGYQTFGHFDDTSVFDLTHLNIATEMDNFYKQFAKEIDYLQEKYGIENVELRWGIVTDYW